MRVILFILSALLTTGLVYVLDIPLPVNGGKTPRLGYFLSPQKGFWQNAEPENASFSSNIISGQLLGSSEVYLDDRLLPHVYAANENDAIFIKG